jgi:hypothetical protein
MAETDKSWMIRAGRLLSRLFSVFFAILLLIWILIGGRIICVEIKPDAQVTFFLFFGVSFSFLWSHCVDLTERIAILEGRLSDIKKQG